MKNTCLYLLTLTLVQPSWCFAENSINFTFIPSPEYSTHQYGIEIGMTGYSRVGILAADRRDSRRPTYGDDHDQVRNDFHRVLSVWSFTHKGAWQNSFVLTAVAGVENDNFKSTQGSRAEVDFLALGVLAGYQWFWSNGFNMTTIIGRALLIAKNVKKDYVNDEDQDVVAYLNKNTETNNHTGIGFILGWAF